MQQSLQIMTQSHVSTVKPDGCPKTQYGAAAALELYDSLKHVLESHKQHVNIHRGGRQSRFAYGLLKSEKQTAWQTATYSKKMLAKENFSHSLRRT